MVDEVLKRHENPKKPRTYKGPFSVQITREADLAEVVGNLRVSVPSDADKLGQRTLTVTDGQVNISSMGSPQFIAGGKTFQWRARHVRAVWDEHGDPIWVNHDLI